MSPVSERTSATRSSLLRRASLGALLLALPPVAFGCTQAIENSLVYSPESYDESFDPTVRAGLPVETLRIKSTEDAELTAYYIAPPKDARGPALLWLHGNGGNIADRVKKQAKLQSELGVGVLAVDYRGYGLSTGDPSEDGLYADSQAAFDALAARPDVDPKRIFVLGESLGGAVAIDLATRRPVAGLVISASFTTLPEVAALHYGFLSSFAQSRFDSINKVGKLSCPKLFVHGQNDDWIPPRMSRSLFDASHAPKDLVFVPGAGHNDIRFEGALSDKMRTLVHRAPSRK
jgi:fermentation-respiration switch protein FrsA (DUF1100 family)